MSKPFVWFHNGSSKPADSIGFYEKLLGWKPSPGPGGMTMFEGDAGPFAGVGAEDGASRGWVPYAEVQDLDAAAKKAVKLGAEVLQPRTRGPAGDFAIMRDPGGATVALWQKG